MDLLKAFKRLINDCKGVKGRQEEEVVVVPHSPTDAAHGGTSLAPVEEPMPLGLQSTMIDMMSPNKLAPSMQASNYFEISGRLPAASNKESVKQSVSFNDASCSPRIGAASSQSISRFSSKNSSGAFKANRPPVSNRLPESQPLQVGNAAAAAAVVKTHEVPCTAVTAVPEEHTQVGPAKVRGPVNRTISLKNLLHLQSYSFISDIDCSAAQQRVDSSDSEDDETGHQQQNGEHVNAMNGSDDVYRSPCLVLSPQNTANRGLQHSASSRIRGFSALSSANEAAQYRNSGMSRVGNVQSPMSRASVGYNGITSNASILSSINDNAIEDVLSPKHKEPKDSNVLAVSDALPRAMKRSVWSVKDYGLGKQLHNGYASKVYSAECKASGLKVVLKVYRLGKMCDLQRCQLFREVRIHSKLQHQNIVQFYCAFMEENCVIIVQEFAAGGDLLRYMYKMGGRLTERAAVKIVLQPFLCALHYLHTEGIIHRDIKPENCLLTGDMVLKIADFGLAVDSKEERANTRAGTLDYMAPEVLRCPTKKTPDQFKMVEDAAHYELAADSWAVGAFAYELLCGKPPFRGSEMLETAHNIIRGDVHFPKELSPGAVDFISCCLEPNPADRLTVIKMLNHPWIKMFQRRKTFSNVQGESALANQQDTVYIGQSHRIAVKTPGMGRLALIAGCQAQTAASPTGSFKERQLPTAFMQNPASTEPLTVLRDSEGASSQCVAMSALIGCP